jgi:plastocyanin
MRLSTLAAALLLAGGSLSAQLSVTPEPADTNLIYALAGPGITVANAVRTCDSAGSGFFNGSATTLGLADGVLLTSGTIWNAQGPNNSGSSSWVQGMPGDADLDALFGMGLPSYDACVLEFDMTVASDTLKLNYVFGSEEYLEFVGSSFNDVFAFFLSGHGITGQVNIATIPGSGDIVAINSVNQDTNSAYFVYNGNGSDAPFDSLDIYVQYDGLTTVLQARYPVTPDSVYHMKLAVADVADGIFDSGVFLATGALGSLRLADAFAADGGGTAVTEGCGSGTLTFTREPVTDEPLRLDFTYAGTADISDFDALPDHVIIPAGAASADLVLTGIEDGSAEGPEVLRVDLYNPQSGYVYRSIEVPVRDGEQVDFSSAQSAPLTVDLGADAPAGALVDWDFGDGNTGGGFTASHTYAEAGSYAICMTATDAEGCAWTACRTVDVTGTNGLAASDAPAFTVQPNPATDRAVLDAGAWTGAVRVTAHDALGRVVYDRLTAERTLDLRAWAPGVYTLTAERDGERRVTRLVVE